MMIDLLVGMSKMPVSTVGRGNRITIPKELMEKKDMHVGDKVYFEVIGVMGRDITIRRATNGIDPKRIQTSSTGDQ